MEVILELSLVVEYILKEKLIFIENNFTALRMRHIPLQEVDLVFVYERNSFSVIKNVSILL